MLFTSAPIKQFEIAKGYRDRGRDRGRDRDRGRGGHPLMSLTAHAGRPEVGHVVL